MTVTSEIHSALVQATGSTFIFAYPSLEIYSDDELLVYYIDTAGVLNLLSAGSGASNYAVTNNNPYADGKSDGFITYPADSSTEILTGEYILMVRVPTGKQTNAFRNLGILLPDNVETAMDKLAHSILFMQEQLDRCLQVDRAVSPAANDLTGQNIADILDAEVSTAADVVLTAADVVSTQAIIDTAFLLDTVTDSTTARTVGLTDVAKWIRCTNGSGITVTLPQDSDVAFVVGTVITFEQTTTGTITFAAGTGATVNFPSTHLGTANTQWAVVQAKLVAVDTWLLFGNLSPV